MIWLTVIALLVWAECYARALEELKEPHAPRIDCALCLRADLEFAYKPSPAYRACYCLDCAIAIREVAIIDEVTR